MIARDSTSYPFLAIAQQYDVSYGEVLAYADFCERPTERHYLLENLDVPYHVQVVIDQRVKLEQKRRRDVLT